MPSCRAASRCRTPPSAPTMPRPRRCRRRRSSRPCGMHWQRACRMDTRPHARRTAGLPEFAAQAGPIPHLLQPCRRDWPGTTPDATVDGVATSTTPCRSPHTHTHNRLADRNPALVVAARTSSSALHATHRTAEGPPIPSPTACGGCGASGFRPHASADLELNMLIRSSRPTRLCASPTSRRTSRASFRRSAPRASLEPPPGRGAASASRCRAPASPTANGPTVQPSAEAPQRWRLARPSWGRCNRCRGASFFMAPRAKTTAQRERGSGSRQEPQPSQPSAPLQPTSAIDLESGNACNASKVANPRSTAAEPLTKALRATGARTSRGKAALVRRLSQSGIGGDVADKPGLRKADLRRRLV